MAAHRDSYEIGSKRGLVVAFNRDRDAYQMPLGLHERRRLSRLVTDFYLPDGVFWSKVFGRTGLLHRHCPGLPAIFVKSDLGAIMWQILIKLKIVRGVGQTAIFKNVDKRLSKRAASEALRNGSDLFLYSGYALEAFSDPRLAKRNKALFVFHPYTPSMMEMLDLDAMKHPEVRESHHWHLSEAKLSDVGRLKTELELATHVCCASSFTKYSLGKLLKVGVPTAVVPYGCLPQVATGQHLSAGRRIEFLFVGQGVQRKGLHHLAKAWARLKCANARLTVVSSKMDPGIGQLITAGNIRLIRGPLKLSVLNDLFRSSDVFVMPSLIEGFGLVYLEALAHGLIVIGTENTGLPDLRIMPPVVNLVRPGSIDELERAVSNAINVIEEGLIDKAEIRSLASEWTWERFRHGVADFAECITTVA